MIDWNIFMDMAVILFILKSNAFKELFWERPTQTSQKWVSVSLLLARERIIILHS